MVPSQDATLKLLTNNISAKLYFNNDWQHILALFEAGKIDYLLWPQSQLMPAPELPTTQWVLTNIGPFQLYHLLHPRHQALAQQVKTQLTRYLTNNVEPQDH